MDEILKILSSHQDWAAVNQIYHTLSQLGFKAFLAGGCVRDALLGLQAKDLDLATDATPDIVEKSFDKTVTVGKSFGVVRVLMAGAEVEVATFRADGEYRDGRHPDMVKFTSDREDALRRDFTINAMFFDLREKKIIDYVGGEADLKRKIIRTVGLPHQRFQEDHLRILRAVRFASQLDFVIDPGTIQAMHELAHLVKTVSGERIRDELAKLLAGRDVEKGLRIFEETGIRQQLFSALSLPKVWPQFYVSEIKWQNFSLFLRGLGRVDLEGYIDYLKFSSHEKKLVLQACNLWANPASFFALTIGKKILKLADEGIQWAILVLSFEDGEFQQESKDLLYKWKNIGEKLPLPFLRGDDLLGRKQGREIGVVLELAFEAQLEGLIDSRTAALLWLEEYLRKG